MKRNGKRSDTAVQDIDLDKVTKRLIVPPGKKISLEKDYDPGLHIDGLSKEGSKRLLQASKEHLSEMQDRLYAQNRYSLLVIFQAMDAAGKDGTIKHVMSGINPQGCQVYSFKAPSDEELDHDYLWRCAKSLPEKGRIGIFNRSYYEEVLIARIHPEILAKQKLPPEALGKNIWKKRFEAINRFEEYLNDNGTRILKFFLNVSKEEQKARFLARLEQPEKNWKFSVHDVAERAHWNKYMDAYEDCFNNTSTSWAPWHIIPADHKPSTRLFVSNVIYRALAEMKVDYPKVSKEQKSGLAEAKAFLLSERN